MLARGRGQCRFTWERWGRTSKLAYEQEVITWILARENVNPFDHTQRLTCENFWSHENRGSHSRSCALLVFLWPSIQLSRNWGSRPHYGPSSGRYSEVCVSSRCQRPGQPRGPGPRYRVHRRHQLLPTAPVEPRHSANRSRAHSWPKNFGAREVFRASGTRRPVRPQPVGIQLRTLHGEAWERRSSQRH